ncbi:hypothetical protein Tco_1335168 [Tanacetum coccineum]
MLPEYNAENHHVAGKQKPQIHVTEKKSWFLDLYDGSRSMAFRSLNVDNDPFHPCEEDVLGPEVLYPSAIGALMNLTKYTRLDISFAVNLLARFISSSTKRHWNRIKHIF